MWKNFMKMQQGFTMLEVLLALMATSICSLLLVQLLTVIAHTYSLDYRVEDNLAIKQLQILFAQGSEYDISKTNCNFRYHGDVITLEQYDDKLVRREGFEVFLQNIDEVTFTQEGGCVYVLWRREEKEMRSCMGCE